MYADKKVVCLILARGGSKGIPRKNVKLIGKKPLIVHSIDAAKKVQEIDKIYVSTEDFEIKKISLENNAFVIDRPDELAKDTSSYLEAVKHLLNLIPENNSNPIIVLLETTSPIRNPLDIKNCIKLFNKKIDCVASISEVKISPVYMYKEKNGFLEKYDSSITATNRQQMEKLFYYNGSILVTTLNFLKTQENVVFGGNMKGYLLDEKNSFDIDSTLDFTICDFLFKKN
jgi:CMP-N,N'-diacetyllegionaminic acid synthase|tara:strand:+ start:87 stop:773 length:687 start_codon:yes stop_codon:yes gene_type:complete